MLVTNLCCGTVTVLDRACPVATKRPIVSHSTRAASVLRCLLLVGALISPAARCLAQVVETRAPDLACSDKSSEPEVIAGRQLKVQGNTINLNTSTYSKVNGQVTVVLCGIDTLPESRKKDLDKLRLYLAGRALTDPGPLLVNRHQGYVLFNLRITPKDRLLWVDILSDARRATDVGIPISVGFDNDKQPFLSAQYTRLQIYPKSTSYIVVFLILLFLALVTAAATTTLLRSSSASAQVLPPFSLGYVQMAWWFFLVVAAYLYMWVVTLDYNTLTDSVLGLIGISGATGMAAVLVDRQKENDAKTARTTLETEKLALEYRLKELAAVNPAPGSAQFAESQQRSSRLAEVLAAISNLPPKSVPASSMGFWRDILSDGSGVTFHRFQIVIWSIVLGIVFVWSVYHELAMPAFSPTLLALMGLSSGTYVGFKVQERPK